LIAVAEPGTYIAEGDLIARIDSRPLRLQRAEQEALLARENINIRQLDSQLRRQRELGGSNLVSEFEIEQTEANRDLAMSDANIIRVRMQQIDDQIQRADIRAPFSGIVISRAHRAGEDVARGEILARMTDIQNMEVRAFVPLKHLPRTTVGDSIEIFATDVSFDGRIRALVPTGDVRSQTFEAIIDLPQSAAANWTVGQLVSVAVPIKARASSLAIPRDALVLRNDGSFVFRISDENKAERIKVEVGDSSGTLVAVTGSLVEGDRVAIRGAENLREGADVKVMLSSQSGAPESDAVEG
jgi:RND family efflux transporter MFP subunit